VLSENIKKAKKAKDKQKHNEIEWMGMWWDSSFCCKDKLVYLFFEPRQKERSALYMYI
jgi:hypothetical protein